MDMDRDRSALTTGEVVITFCFRRNQNWCRRIVGGDVDSVCMVIEHDM